MRAGQVHPLAIMFGASVLVSVAITAQAVLSSPLQNRAGYSVKETHFIPQKWSKIGKPADDFRIHLNIGLTQSSFDELERHLYEGISHLHTPSMKSRPNEKQSRTQNMNAMAII